jgi:prophage regulatory protein
MRVAPEADMRVLSFNQLKPEKGVGFCRVHLDRLIRAGKFPKPIRLGPNRVAWVETEVDEWLAERISQRDLSGGIRA